MNPATSPLASLRKRTGTPGHSTGRRDPRRIATLEFHAQLGGAQFDVPEIKWERESHHEPHGPATIIATTRHSCERVRALTLAELVVSCEVTFLPAP